MTEYFVKQPEGPITADELEEMICTSHHTWMYAHVVLCLVGMVSSGTNALVLTRKTMVVYPLNILLAGLQSCNVVFLATYLPSLVFRISCPVYMFETWLVIFFAVLSNTPRPLVIFTNWMSSCIAVWRFIAITWPLKTRAILSKKHAVILIPSIGAMSTAISVYLFFGLHTNRVDLTILDPSSNVTYNVTVYNRTTDSLGSLHTYDFNRGAMIAIHVLGYLIPSLITVGGNVGLVTNILMKTAKRKKLVEGQNSTSAKGETRMSVTLVVLLLANVFCYVTPGLFILVKYFCVQDCGPSMPGHWHDLFDDYRAVLVLNCFEFFGYYFMSGNFRDTFWSLLRDVKVKLKSITVWNKERL